MMRRVISPRLAIRILWNGGLLLFSVDVDDGRVNATSIARGRAPRYSCADESHLAAAAVEELLLMRAPPLQAVERRRNNLEVEDDISCLASQLLLSMKMRSIIHMILLIAFFGRPCYLLSTNEKILMVSSIFGLGTALAGRIRNRSKNVLIM